MLRGMRKLSGVRNFVSDNTNVPPTGMTLDKVRSQLSGLHFAKEALSPKERQILSLAESLLFYIDNTEKS